MVAPTNKAGRVHFDFPAISMPTALLQSARELPGAINGFSLLSSMAAGIERLFEQISTLDPKAQLPPVIEKAVGWFSDWRAATGIK